MNCVTRIVAVSNTSQLLVSGKENLLYLTWNEVGSIIYVLFMVAHASMAWKKSGGGPTMYKPREGIARLSNFTASSSRW